MMLRKVTEGVGYFFVGECDCPMTITTENGQFSLADFLPDECVEYPSSKEFRFKITVEAEAKNGLEA